MPIKLEHINKTFGNKTVLSDFSAIFKDDCINCLMGPSGVGKTTILNLIMGLMRPDSGIIEGISGKTISAVFQDDQLLNWLNAVDNVAFVCGEKVNRETIESLLNDLGLTGSTRESVSKLSGGMKRRVAIARALLFDADIILLDEPFKGLDDDIKFSVMNIVKQRLTNKCAIFVTHDINEAEYLGAEIIQM